MKVTHTARGFELIEFTDHNGEPCSLQQSSATDLEHAPGATLIWLGCDNNCKDHLGQEMSPRMHLDRAQVAELTLRLQRWLDAGTLALSGERPRPRRKKGKP